MAKLINNDEQLRQWMPNVMAVVKGEVSLFEKVKPHIDVAEEWVKQTFTSDATFNTICGYTDVNTLKIMTAQLVASEAMIRAIPTLDLVLTPNGFGVVNTTNIAPASKERVQTLLKSFQQNRDKVIGELLPQLTGASKWLTSKQATWIGGTLFPYFSHLEAIEDFNNAEDKWAKYVELRERFLDIEATLAEEFISPELMTRLHDIALREPASGMSPRENFVIASIRSEVLHVMAGNAIRNKKMMDVVNFIKRHESSFQEWFDSDTAKLFSPPIFENKKENKGYWF